MLTIVSQLHGHLRRQAGVDELSCEGHVGAGGVGKTSGGGGDGVYDFLGVVIEGALVGV